MAISVRSLGLESTIAPESKSRATPWVEGKGVAIDGRSMPLIIFRNILAATVAAPVLPADTTPSQSPVLTNLVATTKLASFL